VLTKTLEFNISTFTKKRIEELLGIESNERRKKKEGKTEEKTESKLGKLLRNEEQKTEQRVALILEKST
jgi:hypothetical protein